MSWWCEDDDEGDDEILVGFEEQFAQLRGAWLAAGSLRGPRMGGPRRDRGLGIDRWGSARPGRRGPGPASQCRRFAMT